MVAKASKKKSAGTDYCPKCDGYGYLVGEDGVAHSCDCGLNERVRALAGYERSGVPPKFSSKAFENFVAKDKLRKEILKNARSYAIGFSAEEPEGLMLRGRPGSGKTHIAVAILREVISRGYRGCYANFNDLLSRLRDTYNSGARETEGALLAEIDEAELLVLDDVGAESVSDWVRDRLYLIINRRYENARATIITTNCDEAELESRIGPRTASRLYEMCEMKFPVFPEQDWRKANMR